MSIQLTKIALAATLGIALAFTLNSCAPKVQRAAYSGNNTISYSGTAISSSSGGDSTAKNTLTDSRDGKSYQTAKIGTQIWMAENLNYDAEGSECYGNDPTNCQNYGRLYDWNTAMKACPVGWHLPNKDEWNVLVNFAGGYEIAGGKLKSKNGWKENVNGTDDYNFSALPGGSGNSGGNFIGGGGGGAWRSASENSSNYAYIMSMHYNSGIANWFNSNNRSYLYSVRCLQD
jgi:uncharacterized protein (TIGR02145 family)